MSRVHSLILTAAAIAMLATAVSCAGGDDGIGPIRHPEAQAGGDPFDCHDFDAEAADRTTRFTAPGLSLHYTPGVIIERRNGAITFTDIASGHRAALDFTTDTGSLTVDGQPVALAACRVSARTDSYVAIFAVTADSRPVVAVVDGL